VVPISFVSEHVETLEEIDDEFRQLAQECGVTKWRRVPALNTDPGFIQELADIVVSSSAAYGVCVYCARSVRADKLKRTGNYFCRRIFVRWCSARGRSILTWLALLVLCGWLTRYTPLGCGWGCPPQRLTPTSC
jgi:hypothetical protein